MSSNKESLPPGVKMENTYLHYQKGSKYDKPNIGDSKKTETRKAKQISTGFEEDEEESRESGLKAPVTTIDSQKKPQNSLPSGFAFIKPKSSPSTVEAPKKDEYFLPFTIEL